MSRRAAIIEEFDDDTDIPLPTRPPALPNTGARGALIEQIGGSSDEDGDDDNEEEVPALQPSAGPATPSKLPQRPQGPPGATGATPSLNQVTDITPYKKWTCVYPIYIDAKRAYGRGERRVGRAHAVWWPLSKDIADAASKLGLGVLHEVNKSHPRDWDNPGRVRIQWKKDGRLIQSRIRTKKQLLEAIAAYIQRVKPDNVPREPYAYAPTKQTLYLSLTSTDIPSLAPSSTPGGTKPKAITAKGKGKQPAAGAKSVPAPTTSTQDKANGRVPHPPAPLPALEARFSEYSPATASGVLVDAVKAGMAAQQQQEGAAAGPGGAPGTPGGMKGKRKVVRVRA